ncbi:histone-lysine N-methyltransferase 2A isoform X3 [Colossoma macropomum]|uniref:histone-lysine N-methyltransferase 2A isoform X3 n=1 Tax=Colossoma macropomum TaxID=42526 RepID=UPI0018640879|nr:histone-lysine N-methyltransferase 2A isoform X3 [Colossoma macropomum]
MAAAGGGLPASVVTAGANPSATVRGRFPGRPWASRSQLKRERRLRVGRLGAEERAARSRGPRPVNVGATLQEDPCLLRLLELAEKLGRQKEAGFCTSGSEEEGDFTGFQADGRWSLCSGQGSILKSSSAPSIENPPLAPDLSADDKKATTGKKLLRTTAETEQPEKKRVNVLKADHKIERPKFVVKLASKNVTKKNASGRQQVKKASLRGVREKITQKGIKFSHEQENGGVDDEALDKPGNEVKVAAAEVERKGRKQDDTIILENRTRQKKLVWTLTLVKGKRRTSKKRLADNLDQNPSRGFVKTADLDQSEHGKTKDVLTTDDSTSPRTTGKRRRIPKAMRASLEVRTEAGQEDAVSPDGSAGALLRDNSSRSPKKSPPVVKRRKSLFGYRRTPEQELMRKMRESQLQGEGKIPRKRRRLVCYAYEVVDSPVREDQQQELPGQAQDTGAASQQGFAEGGVVSARPSRVIKVPKRFMDDEGMSGLPVKKPAQTEILPNESGIELEQADIQQTQEFKRRRKRAKLHNISDGDGNFVGKAKSQGGKPRGFSGSSDGPQKKVGRVAYDSTHLKIYERLKKLTASLAQRRQKRMASYKDDGVKLEGELQGTEESSGSRGVRRQRNSDLKIEEVNSPGVVRKLAVHVDDTAGQSAVSTVEGGEDATKAVAEGTSLEGTDVQRQDESCSQISAEQVSPIQRLNLSGANKRMLHLLKRAKVQLIKIDQQKQLKSAQLLSGAVRSGDGAIRGIRRRRRRGVGRGNTQAAPQGHPIGGPRIKHVCRAAAVALGQPRAMVPDDIPRLSALPLHEREGIAPSPNTEDLGSCSDPESTGSAEQKPVSSRRTFGLRQKRCFRCKGCCREEDCGRCVFCLDKPKYGGPNKKRQSCIYKKCARIEENKMKRLKVQMKRRQISAATYPCSSGEEEGEQSGAREEVSSQADPTSTLSPTRRQPRRRVTPRCYSSLLESDSTDTEPASGDTGKEQSSSAPTDQAIDTATPPNARYEVGKPRKPGLPRGLWGRRRIDKLQHCPSSQALKPREPSPSTPNNPPTPTGSPSLKLKLKLQLRLQRLPLSVVRAAELSVTAASRQPDAKKAQEEKADGGEQVEKEGAQEQALTDLHCLTRSQSSAEHTPPSVLAALANGFTQREPQAQESTPKIRVDFKEDCNIQNVWAMGGLSILTSVPVAPEYVCLLCASKGHHEMIFCQMCCEPFHRFCLPVDDRPQKDNKENWCCRRCKYCHVCDRKSKHGKPVLQCKRCLYCYHPSCLGPTYPKPAKCNTPWVCMMCIRCKSCGVTPGKSWDMAWNHELNLCPQCSNLHSQGNFCTVCLKCYQEHEFDSKMMQCARCAHWVHPKCEGLTDDLYELLRRLRGKSLVFSCAACSKSHPSGWQEVVQDVLRDGLEKVMSGLLNAPTTCHLRMCSQSEAFPDAESIKDRKTVCDLRAVERKLEEGLYTTLKMFHEDVVRLLMQRLQEEERLPEEQRPTAQAKIFYLRLLEQTFSWFNSQDPVTWKPLLKEFPSGMLPEAVIPPSDEHSYAQWLEEQDRAITRTKETQENIHLKAHDPLNVSRRDVDERQCSLCQQYGDAKPNEAGRLLYLGQNEWAHVNCCIWSAEVQEVKGALLHVHSAVTRGRFMRCERCSQVGATVGCCLSTCQSNYHFMCARASHCVFQSDKKVYCHKHRDLINNKMMNGFEVLRRVYVDFEGISLRRKFLTGLEPESVNVMIGSLQINRLGVLSELSEVSGKLYPVGYQCTRWYWSTVDPRKRCRYTCKVTDVQLSSPMRAHNSAQNQEENCTIAHSPKPHEGMDSTNVETSPLDLLPSTPSPNSKLDSGAESKTPKHPQNRRPVGGTFRPLPSPVSTSHHILTISDLDETRRSKRISVRSRNASPPQKSPTVPMKLRSGGTLNPRSLPFSSPISPLGATENLMSSPSPRRRGRPPSSPSSATSAYSPRQGTIGSTPSTVFLSPRHSPRIQQHFRSAPQESAEVPQDFSASLEPEDAAGMPEDSISTIAVIGDGNSVPLPSDQELLSTHFDADTDVAVASVLNAKLEFDEALLNENVALHCGLYGSGAEAQEIREGHGAHTEGNSLLGRISDEDTSIYSASEKDLPGLADPGGQIEVDGDSVDGDSDHYLNFSRTVVVCDSVKDSAQAGLTVLPTSQSISQLDGADNDSESDASEASGEDNTQEVGNSYHSQDTEPSKSITPNSGRELVCTSTVESFVPESILSHAEPEVFQKTAVNQLSDQQELQESVPLQEGWDVLVDSATEVFAAQDSISTQDLTLQEMQSVSEAVIENVLPTSPVFDPSIDLVAGQEDILADSEPVEDLNEVLLDPEMGHFVSAKDGSIVHMFDSSSVNSVNKDVKSPEQIVLPEPTVKVVSAPSLNSVGKVTGPGALHLKRYVIPQTIPQHRIVKMTVPAGTSLPLSVPVNMVSTSPAASAFQKNLVVASSQVAVNGLDSPKEAPRSRTLAIRIPASRVSSGTGALPSPQVLLVNRSGQVLIKDPQTNTYQLPSANSPSFSHIRQIAKIIHSSNLVQRSVPRVVVTPVPQASPSQAPTTHVVSYSNGAVPSTKVFIRKLPQKFSEVQMNSGVRLNNTAVPVSPVSEVNQRDDAQAIIERAMASHREMANPGVLSPSQFQVHPYLSKLHSPDMVEQSSKLQHRTQPAILSRSKSQVRVKRVSSASERTSIKKSKTDFIEPTVSSSQDELNRFNKVRIKAPTFKDVLDFDHTEAENLPGPKTAEAKDFENKRVTPIECESSEPQEGERGIHDKTHEWVSSRNSDLSDWTPCADWSSDEDSPSPFKQEQNECAGQNQPHLLFKITSDDGFSVEADSIEVAWRAVVDGVQEARTGYRLEQLPLGRMSGARVLGVIHDAVLFLLEQLQGAPQCQSHRFRFHQHEKPEKEPPVNPSGCARAEVYMRKSTFDMFNFLASQHRQLPESRPCDEDEDDIKLKSSRRATSTELPMAMRFRHLEKTSKEAVGVYRSAIHGRGLFCKRNIEAGEMVIEYAGNVIRSVLTDKREKYYDSKGIGCYMFRIDDFDVVDATMHGNAARFINHSCEPNCYSRVINVEGRKHIVIFALRKIYRGEELTYDYKFPIEDASNKLHCNCGARRCRRFLN